MVSMRRPSISQRRSPDVRANLFTLGTPQALSRAALDAGDAAAAISGILTEAKAAGGECRVQVGSGRRQALRLALCYLTAFEKALRVAEAAGARMWVKLG